MGKSLFFGHDTKVVIPQFDHNVVILGGLTDNCEGILLSHSCCMMGITSVTFDLLLTIFCSKTNMTAV